MEITGKTGCKNHSLKTGWYRTDSGGFSSNFTGNDAGNAGIYYR
jgi:hypothetical protein